MYRLLIAATLGADARVTLSDFLKVNCKLSESPWSGNALECDWENKGTYESYFDYCRFIWGGVDQKKAEEAPCGLSYQISSDLKDAAFNLSTGTLKWVYPAGFNEMTDEEKKKQMEPSVTNPACFLKTKGSIGKLICHKIETKVETCKNVVNKIQCGRGTTFGRSNFRGSYHEKRKTCTMEKKCNLNGRKKCSYKKEKKAHGIWFGETTKASARSGYKPTCRFFYSNKKTSEPDFRNVKGAVCRNGVWINKKTRKPITRERNLCSFPKSYRL